MQDLLERFRQNVARELEVQGITPSELARRMETSPQVVWGYMNRNSPGLAVIAQFAEGLDVDPSQLLRDPRKSMNRPAGKVVSKRRGRQIAKV